MKKIFTLAAAVLASFSLWAVVPTTTLDPTDVPTEGWAGKYAPAAIVNGDWVCFSPYEIYQSNAQTWAAKDAGGSTDGSWDATDPFPAQSAWTTNDGKVATVRQGQKGPYYYRITNTTDVAALVKSGSNKKRTVFLEAYELTNGEAPATPTKSISMESSTMAVIALNELDATKEYMIVVRAEDTGTGGSSAGNSNYYAIGFKAVTKTIVSTEESLTAVTINDVAISATDLASLVSNTYLFLTDAYVTAPVVKFTKHIVITYDDQTTKESDEVIEVTSQPATTTWGASATINGNSYYVYTSIAASRTVTYMYGEQVLGTEVVAANSNPKEYAQYESLPLATFEGWYKDAELTQAVVSMAAEVISADVTFYAKFSKAYAESIDFEGMVINNGKSYDVKSALDANFYDYKTIDALDSLNNDKGAARNEPYLGLKIKKQGGYLACNVLPGTTIRIKFGYVAADVLAIAGNDTITLSPTNNKIADLVFPIMVETLVKLQTTTDKTVVIKQIMIDEPIATWMYPITYNIGEGGTVTGWTIAFPNEEVVMNITSNEGYALNSLTYNGTEMVQTAPGAPISFTMPAEAVTVAATFGDIATGIDNTDAEVKSVKFFENGQLFIEKNGVIYNAQGAIVK